MTRKAWIVIDLGFGDAGKGATVDFLVRDQRAGLVVRFNGGAQAGHNVVSPTGIHHTFAQFGAGTLVDGTRTLLGPGFILHPGAMLVEESRLREKGIHDAFARTVIDARALVISPFQQAACRLRELWRGDNAHGTCGIGIGEAVRDSLEDSGDTIRVVDLGNSHDKLMSQQRRIRDQLEEARRLPGDRVEAEWKVLDDPHYVTKTVELWQDLVQHLRVVAPEQTQKAIGQTEVVVFEGAQGVLLDQDRGFHPHTTWSDSTPRGALELLQGHGADVIRLGVTRSYSVRHGLGPFPTQDFEMSRDYGEPHNDNHGWQGEFRKGALDTVLLRYALATCGGVDGLAVNCMDQISATAPMCGTYRLDGRTIQSLPVPDAGDHSALRQLGQSIAGVRPMIRMVPAPDLVTTIESELDKPVWLISEGPTSIHRRWLSGSKN
ncbi:MAG: adenylosuccinate synthetase [bacterium]|nr:adenylosuccinate synthetase [bacterium]